MSAPKLLFIDTCIFDQQNYNFESAAFVAFLSSIADKGLTLLVPDPTYREVMRHIDRSSQEALKALETAERDAPFLTKWKLWPGKKTRVTLQSGLRQIAERQWSEFLTHFSVVKLKYDGVSINEVMNWYDNAKAPFAAGKKSKEFPDALVLSSLLAYSRAHKFPIAVVSRDQDLRTACSRYSELSYFPSLPAYSEGLISGDARVEKVRKAIELDAALIIQAAEEQFYQLGFFHEYDRNAEIKNVEVLSSELTDFSIVNIGDRDAVISFTLRVAYSARIRMDDRDSVIDADDEYCISSLEYRGTVSDWTEITGVAKFSMTEDWMKLESILHFQMGEDDVVATEMPDKLYPKE